MTQPSKTTPMNRMNVARIFRFCLAMLLLVGIGGVGNASGQDTGQQAAVPSKTDDSAAGVAGTEPAASQTETTSSRDVYSPSGIKIGIDGVYRIGRWCPVQIDPALASKNSKQGRSKNENPSESDDDLQTSTNGSAYSLLTRDGDGARVRYESPATSGVQELYVKAGSEAAPLIVETGNEVLFEGRFPAIGMTNERPVAIERKTPWIVVIGDMMGIETVGVDLTHPSPKVALSVPTADEFPSQSIGYDGVDWIIVNSNGIKTLRSLSPKQSLALESWVRQGGHLLVCWGESLLSAGPELDWIKRLTPLKEFSTVRLDPSTIESEVRSQSPLDTFSGINLPRDVGELIINGRTTRRIRTPIAVRYRCGFGELVVFAGDLDRAPFADWPDRLNLLDQLLDNAWTNKEWTEETGSDLQTSYDDLSGQLRSVMDRFETTRRVPFSLIALILLALVAIIGPLDFWFLNRVLKKPTFGWITFPAVAILLTGFLWWLSAAATRNTSQQATRRLEIIDLDLVDRTARGWSIDFLRTDSARELNWEPTFVGEFETELRDPDSPIRFDVSPFGYAGAAFGNIGLTLEDTRLPVYTIASRPVGGDQRSEVVRLPFAPRSSKGLLSRFDFTPHQSLNSAATARRGGKYLTGPLKNPLPIDLLNARVVFEGSVYLLNTRFRANRRITDLGAVPQKNFRWLLTGQKAIESGSRGEPWQRRQDVAIPRMAEMMMHHSAAGGIRYTSLHHDELKDMDITGLIGSDRCVLVGQIERSALSDMEADDANNDTTTFVRVVIPVQKPNSRFESSSRD